MGARAGQVGGLGAHGGGLRRVLVIVPKLGCGLGCHLLYQLAWLFFSRSERMAAVVETWSVRRC